MTVPSSCFFKNLIFKLIEEDFSYLQICKNTQNYEINYDSETY